ncbi:MAG: Sec-dependent nitrous-oxide reductase [Elusimicrobia bacterium]|nr:Sec-dependent nitrous-oxide reductase [Elusimicrobiota bacterium]
MNKNTKALSLTAAAALTVFALAQVPGKGVLAQFGGGLPAGLEAVIKARELSPDDVEAALKTYVPPGSYDEFLLFASGGQAGNIEVLGVPSMRLIKNIAVFSKDSWQGYGIGDDDSKRLFKQGMAAGKLQEWGDVHHPALSLTNGQYDGQFLFANDKANGRIGVVDLRDFKTRQIVKNPLIATNHCGAKLTENSEYYVEGAQFGNPMPFTNYAPMDKYKELYRGSVTFWPFNRAQGKLDQTKTFTLELPPYYQDLGGMGKKVSHGWVFINTYNAEMATPGALEGKPAMEIQASQREMDYMHVIHWKKAEELLAAGKLKVNVISGMRVIPIAAAVEAGILYNIPEPKSPHGADVTPDGRFVVVSGKLDPHVTIFSFAKIQKAIADKTFDGKDEFGIPIIKFDAAVEAQVELGLGPLHTEYDDKGYAYTSMFLDSSVNKWTLDKGPRGEKPWTMVESLPVHYNTGHLTVAGGDTVKPYGKYLVTLNKWSLDRALPVGPLHPQNLQLIDISGETMKLLADAPVVGEPHYAVMAPAKLFKPWKVYPEVGLNGLTLKKSPTATEPGRERIVRNGRDVHVFMTAIRSRFVPDRIDVREGDRVHLHITNVDRAQDATHGFALSAHNINLSLDPGLTVDVDFTADRSGVFPFYCSEFCSALHMEMMGYLTVAKAKAAGAGG